MCQKLQPAMKDQKMTIDRGFGELGITGAAPTRSHQAGNPLIAPSCHLSTSAAADTCVGADDADTCGPFRPRKTNPFSFGRRLIRFSPAFCGVDILICMWRFVRLSKKKLTQWIVKKYRLSRQKRIFAM